MAFSTNNWNKPTSVYQQQPSVMNRKTNNGQRFCINQLGQNLQQTIIVGMVIVKNDVRSIMSKKGNETNLLSLTIRDSVKDTINVSCWGNADYIMGLSQLFHIGDVVEIQNAQIQLQQANSTNAQYKPDASSDFQLVLSEHYSKLELFTGDKTQFLNLMNIPLKPNCPMVSIEDIQQGQEQFKGQHVSILIAIKKIGQMRELTSKVGKQLKKCDVIAFDQTCKCFNITIWDSEWIEFAQTWTPHDCIILAEDLKVNFDEFRQAMCATTDGKTVFTLNPDIREAHVLFSYIQTVVLDDDSVDVNLETIQEQYTVQSIRDTLLANGKGESIRGFIYACLTNLNLDGHGLPCVATRCSFCRCILDPILEQCNNLECPAGCGRQATDPIQQLDTIVSLTDHSGTFDNCRLSGAPAEALLGCTVLDFLQMNPMQKTMLKWEFLMERAKWYFQAKLQNAGKTIGIQILSGEKTDVGEWCTKALN